VDPTPPQPQEACAAKCNSISQQFLSLLMKLDNVYSVMSATWLVARELNECPRQQLAYGLSPKWGGGDEGV
jgi:hypothetical protein